MLWIDFGLCVLAFVPLLLLIRESPKFLVSVKKFKEARQVYNYIAKINKTPMFISNLKGEDKEEDDGGEKLHGIGSLCKIKSLRLSLIVVPFTWFAMNFISQGITLSLGDLNGSIYANGYSMAGAYLFSDVLIAPMANTIGRKRAMIIWFLFGGVACLLYEPLRSLGETFTYICFFLASFGSSCTYDLIYLVTS